jgi:hypothetical protein
MEQDPTLTILVKLCEVQADAHQVKDLFSGVVGVA